MENKWSGHPHFIILSYSPLSDIDNIITLREDSVTSLFYKPSGAWAADFIPYWEDGRFHLFYLHDWRNPTDYGEGTPWYQISTSDFIDFKEHGMMLRRGGRDEQDQYVFTGSVIRAEGRYHIFYTGHNPYFRRLNRAEQGIMHAISDDLLTWRKVSGEPFFAPGNRYEPHDWRDPFVYWNEEASEYWMLVAARLKAGPARRRGCTALCTSKDLNNWQVHDPFYAPGLYYTHECPDLFKMGEWWYLLFSEFTDKSVTRYRMSRSLAGPWLTPEDDQFDGRAFYAAKSASDGNRRFLFGWNPTREGEKDDGAWQWGGNLVVHEMEQRSDGTLSVCPPESIEQAFIDPRPPLILAGTGQFTEIEGGTILTAPGTFASVSCGLMPERCKLEVTLTTMEPTRAYGLMLRTSGDLDKAYYIRFEPLRNRLVFDMWPRSGDVPFMVGMERPLSLSPGIPVTIKIFAERSICEIYINDQKALSTRMYDHKSGQWGLFVEQGKARFERLSCSTML